MLKNIFQGYYTYVDVTYSTAAQEFDKGRVLSPTVTGDSSGMCVEFWYFMYGTHVNELRVRVKQNGLESDVLWSRKGTRQQIWYHGQVYYISIVYYTSITFKLFFM